MGLTKEELWEAMQIPNEADIYHNCTTCQHHETWAPVKFKRKWGLFMKTIRLDPRWRDCPHCTYCNAPHRDSWDIPGAEYHQGPNHYKFDIRRYIENQTNKR